MNRPTRNTLFGCVLCLLLAGFWSCAAKAEDRPFEFLTLDCLLTGQISTTVENGKRVIKTPHDTLALTFSNFNYANHTASVIGNAGGGETQFVPSYKKAVLIEFSQTGNPVVTSISEPHGGKAMAFQSRHIWMIGSPVISELQGDCSVRK